MFVALLPGIAVPYSSLNTFNSYGSATSGPLLALDKHCPTFALTPQWVWSAAGAKSFAAMIEQLEEQRSRRMAIPCANIYAYGPTMG